MDARSLTLLLASSLSYVGASFDEHPRQSELTEEPEEGSGNNSFTTPGPTSTIPSAPILSPSAIANIISSVLAVVFLTAILCYLVRSYNKNEQKIRIRTSLENNKRIDEQLAAAKARAEQRTKQTNLTQGSTDNQTACIDSAEVVITNAECKPQYPDSQPLNIASEEGSINIGESLHDRTHFNREVVEESALTTSRT